MYHPGASLRQTASHFNIPSMSTVRSWEQIYCEKYKETLYEENRSMTNKMVAKKPRKSKKITESNDALLAELNTFEWRMNT